MKNNFKEYIKTLEQKNRKSDVKIAKTMLKQIEENPEESIEIVLEENLKSSKGKKERHYNLILEYYDYLEKTQDYKVESTLKEHTIIDNPVLRRLDMIKYFHNHKSKTEEIAEHYMLDRRTLSNDLKALEEGIEVLGTTLELDIQRENWNYYTDKSVHPVMLKLEMPEVVAMTVGLLKNAKTDTLFRAQYKNIAKQIYESLSEYGKLRIKKLLKTQNLEKEILQEVEKQEKQLSEELITMFKANCKGTIKAYDEDKEYIYLNCKILDYKECTITIETQNKIQKIIEIQNIYSCTSHLD